MTCPACGVRREQWQARFREVIELWYVERLEDGGIGAEDLPALIEECVATVCDDVDWPEGRPETIS